MPQDPFKKGIWTSGINTDGIHRHMSHLCLADCWLWHGAWPSGQCLICSPADVWVATGLGRREHNSRPFSFVARLLFLLDNRRNKMSCCGVFLEMSLAQRPTFCRVAVFCEGKSKEPYRRCSFRSCVKSLPLPNMNWTLLFKIISTLVCLVNNVFLIEANYRRYL